MTTLGEALATGTSGHGAGEFAGDAHAQGGDGVVDVAFRPDRRRLVVGSGREGQVLGGIEIDSNTVERAIRPLVLSRKNALFASGDDGGRRWADMASLIETCKMNGVNPQAYLADLLTRLVNGWPQSRIDELMPWCWGPEKPAELQPAG